MWWQGSLTIEILGLLAALASLFAYLSEKMIPLRIAAIVANALFALYFFEKDFYPQFVLNAILTPLNFFKLWKVRRLLQAVRAASRTDFNFDWLKPYMTPLKIRAGETLYHAGDEASDAFIIVSGTLTVVERGVELGPGAFFGEMALFAEDQRRTASILAKTNADLLRMQYTDFIEMAAENPVFSFYVMRLLVRRAQHNEALTRIGASAMRAAEPKSAENEQKKAG
jgi:CRP/FNR family cyclic AMP-dependent transcriptional regulator